VVYKGATLNFRPLPFFPSYSQSFTPIIPAAAEGYKSHVPCVYFSVVCVGHLHVAFFSIVEQPSLRAFFSLQSFCSFASHKVAREWLVQWPLWCASFCRSRCRTVFLTRDFRAFPTTPFCIGMGLIMAQNCTRSSCYTARIRRWSNQILESKTAHEHRYHWTR